MAAVIFKCPNCGGDLQFEPGKQTFRCEYCLSEFSQGQMENLTENVEEKEPDRTTGDVGEAVVYSCPGCGAEIATTKPSMLAAAELPAITTGPKPFTEDCITTLDSENTTP